MSTVFAKSAAGREGVWPALPQHELSELLPAELLRDTQAGLPQLSELDVVRHFTALNRVSRACTPACWGSSPKTSCPPTAGCWPVSFASRPCGTDCSADNATKSRPWPWG